MTKIILNAGRAVAKLGYLWTGGGIIKQ
jgi:hypothetical protein